MTINSLYGMILQEVNYSQNCDLISLILTKNELKFV